MWSLPVHPNYYKKKLLFFPSSIRINGKNFIFWDKKKQKSEINNNKKVIKIDDIDFNKILVSKG